MKKLTIYTNQIGIIYKNGQVNKVFASGEYWISLFSNAMVYDMSVPFHSDIETNILLQNEDLKALLHVIEIKDQEFGVLIVNGLFKQVLNTGTYLYWKGANEITCQIINTYAYNIDESVDRYLLSRPELAVYVRTYMVDVYEKGILYADETLVKILEPGTYRYWKNPTSLNILKTDMRQQTLEMNGQEILTKDKAQLRMNFTIQYRVTDIVKALVENKDFERQLYVQVQLSLREVIGRLTFDELMESKDSISAEVLDLAQGYAANLGVDVTNCGIRDIILSGEIKDIMNQVLIAEKRAQANIIMRREETASTRSLLNTARLMEENVMLMKLKEMEYVEKIAEKINTISLSGNGQIVDQLKTIFVKQ